MYAAFVLILVLGLRKGEVLRLTWELVHLDSAELYVGEQLQRSGTNSSAAKSRPGHLKRPCHCPACV